MKVLISVASVEEARCLTRHDVDIVDVKNPAEGSLGAATPRMLRNIVRLANDADLPVSAALGDLPARPGTAALAAAGAAFCGARYVKAGLLASRTLEDAALLLREVRRAVEDMQHDVQVVGASYADYMSFGGLSPEHLVEAAASAGCDVVMLDTLNKDGRTLFDHLDAERLAQFIQAARRSDLQIALAGSIQPEHLTLLDQLAPDWIGLRGAVCRDGDRDEGIDEDRLKRILETIRSRAPVSRWTENMKKEREAP